MATAIQLDDALASKLRSEATARRLSVEEFRGRLLAESLQHIEASNAWRGHNQRRIELIRKSTTAQFMPAEQAELDGLQVELYQRMQATDRELLSKLSELKKAVLP